MKTRRHFIVLLAGLAALFQAIIVPAADVSTLPNLGDESGSLISPQEETRLGQAFMRQARAQMHFLDDPELIDYLESLGSRLISQTGQNGQEYRFFVVDDPSINAFAVPGGYITVHTGLVLATETEGELASVLAHEIAHISQRHIPRMLAAQQKATGPAMLAMLAAILLLSAGHAESGQAALALSTAGMAQNQINFTRTHEEEADRVGTQLLVDAGLDVHAMPVFFKRLQNWSRLYATSLPEYLSTHPLTLRRISESENRASQYPKKQFSPNTSFQHFRAKIRAREGVATATASQFRTNLSKKKYLLERAERYGYALALARGRQFGAARNELQRLIRRYPQYIYYYIALAELELSAGQTDSALALYKKAYRQSPTHRALLLSYADALLQADQPVAALDIAKAGLRLQPDNPEFYRLVAQAAGKAARHLEAHQALAEQNYLSGNYVAAIQQLNIAFRYAGNNDYEKSRIEARTREIKSEAARYTNN